jgi:tRNA threonylcarbamoyladenosine biosynthesis protein TsaB
VLTLAFDTSGFAGSVAVLDGDCVLSEIALAAERRSAQTLAPAMIEALSMASVAPKQVQLVATTIGPGSFTGLRVGVTTAKTFAYAVGADVLGISTLETIAQQSLAAELPGQVGEIQAILHAERKEVFVGRFAIEREGKEEAGAIQLRRLDVDRVLTGETWLAGLTSKVLVTGPGLKRWHDRLPSAIEVASDDVWQPRATTVGKMAWRDYRQGRRDDYWKISPIYLRPSYAEEKAAKKQ